MNLAKKIIGIAAAVASVALPLPAIAQTLGPTLGKINESNTMIVGYREAAVPFSYYDNQQNVVGFSHDLCLKVVDAVKAKLNKPKLALRLVPVTSQNRIALLQNGSIDIECGVTTNTNARHAQVTFSDTIFVALTRLLVNKDAAIKDFNDLTNATVVTNAGTTAESIIRRMNVEKHMGMSIISTKDYGESFLTLETGRAKAFMLDDILLSGARSTAHKPDDWIVTGTPQSKEPYAFMLRKDDPEFKRLVDATLGQVMTSGEIDGLYARWFQKPIPPRGVNFDFPMTQQLRDLYAHPDDRAAY
ncbi:MAG: transporter substrate-binding domain-containing protein [Janthinobacterium lividum]